MTVYYLTHHNTVIFPFLRPVMEEAGARLVYVHPPVRFRESVNALIGAWRAVRKARHGDVIVAYMCSAGVLCWWVSRLTGKKVSVVGCNLTLKGDGSRRTAVMAWLYRKALKSPRFTLTVTSERYGRTMEERLGTTRPFPLLRDYGQFPGMAHGYRDNGKRIFFGGQSQRDWHRCLRVARLMPDWHFVIVGWNGAGAEVPRNVRTIARLPFSRFMEVLSQATVVLNLVRHNCPAGLVVMMEATWLGKLVATNSNDVTQEYVTPERGVIAETDEELVEAIRRCYAQPEEAAKRVKAMQTFLKENCSEEVYAGRLREIVMGMQSYFS